MSDIDVWWTNLSPRPDRELALVRYARLAARYEATTGRIRTVRRRLIELLQLRPGERVIDFACGAGAMLPVLARGVGPSGSVVGVEQSPAMATLARSTASDGPPQAAPIQVAESPVEDFRTPVPADAAVLCYTHDVLQNPAAVEAIVAALRPGARLAVAGLCTLPWPWGAPVNAVVLWRARRYLTTWHGLAQPWRLLQEAGVTLDVVERYHLGTGYFARGTVGAGAQLPGAR